jgi:oligopeptide transport system substrate-binding protein
VLAALAVTALALVAAGCGGGDDEEAAPAPPAETGADTGAPGGGGGEPAAEQVLRYSAGSNIQTDPALATDTTSFKVVGNVFEGLVKLSYPDLEPQPAMAESWDVEGAKVTFHLRQDGTWSNGEPVTANDFVYAWKRALSPELAADYAYQLFGVAGAADYNACEENCDQLADAVGVRAVDDYTFEVTLTSEQPWFIQQVSHTVFSPVPQATVEELGDSWAEPGNIVSNGPFLLEEYQPDASFLMVKNPDWHDADSVALDRIEGRIIVDGVTAIQAFEAGEVDALQEGSIPPAETARLKETEDYQRYATLGTSYYGFNVEAITDVNQRRAMSLAIDRQTIIDNITQDDATPATGFTPLGMPGFDVITPNSPWTPAAGDVEQAQQLMSQVQNPKTNVNLFVNDAPGNRDIAVAIQANLAEIGIESTIKVQEWQQYLEFLGPPPNETVDVYRLGWGADFPDAINFLELWTCDSGNNNTNWCNEEFDGLIDQARATPDDDARYELYAQAEDLMFGENGEMPIIPLYFDVETALERPSVQDTLNLNALYAVDFTAVVVQE